MPENKTSKVELVAPAGTPEKLRIALRYGADAVYLSGKEFGLRKRAGDRTVRILELYDKGMNSIEQTQPNRIILAGLSENVDELDILRRK